MSNSALVNWKESMWLKWSHMVVYLLYFCINHIQISRSIWALHSREMERLSSVFKFPKIKLAKIGIAPCIGFCMRLRTSECQPRCIHFALTLFTPTALCYSTYTPARSPGTWCFPYMEINFIIARLLRETWFSNNKTLLANIIYKSGQVWASPEYKSNI